MYLFQDTQTWMFTLQPVLAINSSTTQQPTGSSGNYCWKLACLQLLPEGDSNETTSHDNHTHGRLTKWQRPSDHKHSFQLNQPGARQVSAVTRHCAVNPWATPPTRAYVTHCSRLVPFKTKVVNTMCVAFVMTLLMPKRRMEQFA